MLTTGIVCGFIGAGFTLLSYMMKSMMPLRIVALFGCLFFVAYGWLEAAIPSLILYSIMVLVNIKKIWQLKQLTNAIENAKSTTPIAEWLLPHMTCRTAKAGQVLWNKGDLATEMIYLESGTVRMVEYQEVLGAGAILGEIGIFSSNNKRTLTIVCETDCTLHSLTSEEIALLYYQNPKIGFHMIRLILDRLSHDIEKVR